MKALIFYGGWAGHEPEECSQVLADGLSGKGVEVERVNHQDPLQDADGLAGYDVIVPYWTMGTLEGDAGKNLQAAVDSGVGLAGCHGGMGDAFRGNIGFEWMVGGLFVGHPYTDEYEVRLTGNPHPTTADLPRTFPYKSEQYYMLVDPANHVLAETIYHRGGQDVVMPVVWTKSWGKGRVWYSSLGHKAQEFSDYPHVLEMTLRGIIWAGEGKAGA